MATLFKFTWQFLSYMDILFLFYFSVVVLSKLETTIHTHKGHLF